MQTRRGHVAMYLAKTQQAFPNCHNIDTMVSVVYGLRAYGLSDTAAFSPIQCSRRPIPWGPTSTYTGSAPEKSGHHGQGDQKAIVLGAVFDNTYQTIWTRSAVFCSMIPWDWNSLNVDLTSLMSCSSHELPKAIPVESRVLLAWSSDFDVKKTLAHICLHYFKIIDSPSDPGKPFFLHLLTHVPMFSHGNMEFKILLRSSTLIFHFVWWFSQL